MSKHVFFLLTLLITHGSLAQNCLSLADYAPGPQDDTTTLRLTWVITKSSTGQSHWKGNYAQDKFDIEQNILKNWVNPKYASVSTPSVPNPTNTGFIADTKIRFALDTILYITHDTIFKSNNVNDPKTLYENWVPAFIRERSIVIFNMDYDVSDPTNVGLPSVQDYYGEAFRNGESRIDLWGNTVPLWDPNYILAHELGHILGLNHTWCPISTTLCDEDGYDDTPKEILPCPPLSTCPNNVMGPFGTTRDYFSPTQIGRMHQWIKYFLSPKVKGFTYNAWVETPITQNTTYNGIISATTGLRITSGNTLKVTGTLLMPPYSKIIVEPNARLVLDCGSIKGYGGIWKGVVLLGQNWVPQDTLTQAKLIMRNNSSIAYALDGVRNYENACNPTSFTGGIIEVSDSRFINNVRDVGLQGYLPVSPALTLPFFNSYKYQAEFKNVTFQKTRDYRNPDGYIRASSVYLDGIQGVLFKDCEFSFGAGFNTSTAHAKTAILAVNGGVNMLDGGNAFNGLQDAIVLRNTQPRYIGSQINNNSFFWCERAITNEGALSWNTFTGNSFVVAHRTPVSLGGYGYQMPYATYVKGNMAAFFVNNLVRGNGQGNGLKAAGLVVNNVGETNMKVEFNHFRLLTIGAQSIGKNRSVDGSVGLEYYCNRFYSNSDNDIQVLPGNLLAPSAQDGVKKNQGSPGTTSSPPLTDELAGNRFNSSNPIHFDNFSAASTIQYHHHDAVGTPQVVPVNRNNTNPTDHSVAFDISFSCPIPLTIGPDGDTLGEFDYPAAQAHTDVLLYGTEADALEAQRDALVDGGNTWQLEAEILYSSDQQDYDLYMDLMDQSPYLSEGPIQELIERPGFPDIMLRNVLIANPHIGREPWVIDELSVHHPNMPQYMIDDIIDETISLDGLDYLDAAISDARGRQLFAAQVAVKDVVENPGEDPFTEVQNILAVLPYSNYQYIRVELFQQNGAFAEANQLLTDLPAILSFSNDADMMEIHGHYVDWFNFKEEVYTNELQFCSLDDTRLDIVEGFVNNQDMTGAWARSILSTYHGSDFDYPVYMPAVSSGKRKTAHIFPDVPRPLKSFYPNPTSGFINVNLEPNTSLQHLGYFIYNMEGMIVQSGRLYSSTDVIRFRNLTPGQYIITVGNKDKIIHSEKVIVK